MISVHADRRLQAAVLAFKRLDRDLKRTINQATRDTLNPVWKSLVQTEATTPMAARMLTPGTRIAAGNPPRALAAKSTRKIGKGKRLQPSRDYYLWEFGVNPNEYHRYERKNRTSGGYHVVKRRTGRGLPRRTREGRVVYPAFAQLAPRAVELWLQIIVRKAHEAAEGK